MSILVHRYYCQGIINIMASLDHEWVQFGSDTHLHSGVGGDNSIINIILILISLYSISEDYNGGIVMNPPACLCVDGNDGNCKFYFKDICVI